MSRKRGEEYRRMKGKDRKIGLTSSGIMTILVVSMVFFSLLAGIVVFVTTYRASMIQNVKTSSDQAAVQVERIVDNYMDDISSSLKLIEGFFLEEDPVRDVNLNHMADIRSDVTAITSYDPETGELTGAWTGHKVFKKDALANLSFNKEEMPELGEIVISRPHVESLLLNEYPWVVSISTRIRQADGTEQIVVLDSRFSQIASYVDTVGVGSHGYCFIMDQDGTIIYHPQQQLIFAGLKEENTQNMTAHSDGSYEENSLIYTIRTRKGSSWRIVAVSFVDELIEGRLKDCLILLAGLLLIVLAATIVSSVVLSRYISRPIHSLNKAMGEFEANAEGFSYEPVYGSLEVTSLSNAFGHLVIRIQELMNQVRNEEIVLRKTELRALQAQINPHFLYNTLDSIAWMCEEGRTKDAVEMVNALARLFRISISKGHELIPVEKEVEHAKSYLQIQKFRYKNQFQYSFDVQESCLHYYCNKITLQPIIENAIYHGLNRMIDEGFIEIKIFEDGGDVVFTVEDNGVGMTKEQCESILHKEVKGQTGGIGIKNVNDRVKIYFGEQYGMKIESELDEGTKVSIRMPKLEEDSYEAR
ncbi:MAG: sensor histidine kinase [Clostridium sp.]|jgi:two-component system, sensor histidine kinase YesM